MKTENYESPIVEVIEVEIEQGFATSGAEQAEGQADDFMPGWSN